MNIGVIGLGKMGSAIALRLVRGGFTVIGYDLQVQVQIHNELASHFTQVNLIEEVAVQATIIWLMVPAGVVDTVITELTPCLNKNSIIIDGGNSHFKDSVRRYQTLKKLDLNFLDCGVSGGILGGDTGFSLMIGGDKSIFEQCKTLFEAVAAVHGYAYCGPSGAGHYVKMVHNGIEYALLESYAEGFELLHAGEYKNLDLEKISNIWMHDAIIRSFILSLCENIFKKDQKLDTISGVVDESGTARWAVEEAARHNISVNLIKEALQIRQESHRTGGTYATKLVALLRNAFGGHPFYRK